MGPWKVGRLLLPPSRYIKQWLRVGAVRQVGQVWAQLQGRGSLEKETPQRTKNPHFIFHQIVYRIN